ncbi:hypothetical protein N9936_01255, partial [bacterium]|nr:hypothetical protein [bacterium]
LNKAYGKSMTDAQIKAMENTIAAMDAKLKGATTGKKDIWQTFGLKLDDKDKEAIANSLEYVKQSFGSIMAARLETTARAVEATQQELDVAKENLDTQLQLARDGNEVDIELAIQKYNDKKALNKKAVDDQRKAQKAQEAIDTASQASSLITAVANIISGYAKLGPAGQIASVVAIGAMFASFAASRIQAAKATKNYHDGGAFAIGGGSHQSGNDTSLGVHNGMERRVEGGEIVSVFNRKAVKQYGKNGISDIVQDINGLMYSDKVKSDFTGAGAIVNLQMGRADNTDAILQENVRLRRELTDVLRSIPQPIMNIDRSGFALHVKEGNTTYLNVENENRY